MFKKISSNKGFTLIEMLVVIAIIGILSGIFLVGFQSYRSSAKDAKLISDTHRAQTDLELYYNQNGSYMGFNSCPTGIACSVADENNYTVCALLSSSNQAAMDDYDGGTINGCGDCSANNVYCLGPGSSN